MVSKKFCTGCYCHRSISEFPPLRNGAARKQCTNCMRRAKRAHREPRVVPKETIHCPCGKTILSTSLRNHKLGVFHRTHPPMESRPTTQHRHQPSLPQTERRSIQPLGRTSEERRSPAEPNQQRSAGQKPRSHHRDIRSLPDVSSHRSGHATQSTSHLRAEESRKR